MTPPRTPPVLTMAGAQACHDRVADSQPDRTSRSARECGTCVGWACGGPGSPELPGPLWARQCGGYGLSFTTSSSKTMVHMGSSGPTHVLSFSG